MSTTTLRPAGSRPGPLALSNGKLYELAERLDGRPVPGVKMTEEEFEAWCDEDVKAEWVDGEVIVMPPSSGEHVDFNGWLYRLVSDFIEVRTLGLTRGPEFQVRLVIGRRHVRRVPDLMFVSEARRHLLRRTYLDGAPDLVMEIVSADSQSRDRRDKFQEYEAAGVREYWIVDPLSRRVEGYRLGKNGRYELIPEDRGRLFSTVLPGFYLRPAWLWQGNFPSVSQVVREISAASKRAKRK